MYYIDIETIKKAYESLTRNELKDPNVMFNFLIMKACGINKLTYEAPEFAVKNGLYYASRISSLFSPEETAQPKKYGFINPFSMKQWGAQPISEPLDKWVGARLKNNIIGGGTQWRGIIDLDTKTDDKKIKFKYDYVNIIKNATLDSDTVDLVSIAIWSNRFTVFEEKATIKEICEEFKRSYKLSPEEVEAFFNTKQEYEIDFSDKMHDASIIRDLIGKPEDVEAWSPSAFSTDNFNSYVMEKYEYGNSARRGKSVTIEEIKELLSKYYQVILSGPPGTSKSFYAGEIARDYDEVFHVQFHPQYSYQNFVGGYFVDKTNVVYRNGLLLDALNLAYNSPNKKYLLIIDEFNRANVSQVLGETIQCLDRNDSVCINVDGELHKINIPKSIHIIATLNSTDKTLGTIDYAIKRRFMEVYCPPDPSILIDKCPSSGFISLCDFLTKLNINLERVLGSRDLTVGHAIFLNESVRQGNLYCWDYDSFLTLYNHKILPIVEDFCSHNKEMVEDVLGYKLSDCLEIEEFIIALKEYLEIQ